MSIPAVFIALAGVALILALIALWQSLRSAFGAVPEADGVRGAIRDVDVTDLEHEKNTLLRAIKDLAFERELGKISDADFERIDRGYRQRAKEVLRLLDGEIAPFMEQAEKLLEIGPASSKKKKKKAKQADEPKADVAPRFALKCPHCEAEIEREAVWCGSCKARIAPHTCAKCDATNDPDAKFCKECATALPRSPEEPASAAKEDA
jgi:hypothetical protein